MNSAPTFFNNYGFYYHHHQNYHLYLLLYPHPITFTECLLCARHAEKYHSCIILLNHQQPSDVSTIMITSYRRSSEVRCLPKITQLIGDRPRIHLRSASIAECCKLPHFISIHCYLLRGIITPLEKNVKDQLFQEPLLAQNFPRRYLKPQQ